MDRWYGVYVVEKIIMKNLDLQTLDLFAYPQTDNAKTEKFISNAVQEKMGIDSIFIHGFGML
jgi:hypothetical protein